MTLQAPFILGGKKKGTSLTLSPSPEFSTKFPLAVSKPQIHFQEMSLPSLWPAPQNRGAPGDIYLADVSTRHLLGPEVSEPQLPRWPLQARGCPRPFKFPSHYSVMLYREQWTPTFSLKTWSHSALGNAGIWISIMKAKQTNKQKSKSIQTEKRRLPSKEQSQGDLRLCDAEHEQTVELGHES